ncbi:MAG: hypothetical protein M3N11_04005 [Actinomycetota bacterium]|nr:hypothetical protein [Actinomycetota bacterium]
MAGPSTDDVVAALLDRHGRTFADDVRIDVASGKPSPLFRLLCASLLMSARISAGIAVAAARALADAGWTTAERMAASTWEERARVLNEAGYARYDERTSTMLGETTTLVLDRYGGDLRKLRQQAGCDPAEERRLIKECKGIGDVGADIFFREVQVAWPELHPFADRRAISAAERLGLGSDAGALAGLVSDPAGFTRLVAALVRVELDDDHQAVLQATESS